MRTIGKWHSVGRSAEAPALVEYSPYAYEVHEDPYPVYRQLREEAPLYRNDALGFWALSRHADVQVGLRDTARLSNVYGVSLDRSSHAHADAVMSFLAMDPPRHTRMRALVSRGFTPRRVAALEPRIRELAVQHLEPLVAAGGGCAIADFAGRLPMDVISEMLGVPDADRDELRHLADTIVHREEGVHDVPPEGVAAALRTLQYLAELVKEREARPRDDLTSALLAAELDGERLGQRDVVAFLHLMIIAGNETTTKLLGNALFWLARHPEQRARVASDPAAWIPGWVEETLRYDGSTQALARTVAQPVAFHGCTLEPGDRLLLLLGSANRDERVFPEPERYDLARNTTAMLSFGQGAHFCLGAALARLEARVALEAWWERFPDYVLDVAASERVHSANVRGFARLSFRSRP